MPFMHTITFSTKVSSNKVVPIPVDLQSQVTAGSAVRVFIIIDQTQIEDVLPPIDDQALQNFVQQLRSRPAPLGSVTPAREQLTHEEVERLLENDEPMLDIEAWNTEWDEYERELKRQYAEDELALLQDITTVSR